MLWIERLIIAGMLLAMCGVIAYWAARVRRNSDRIEDLEEEFYSEWR